MYIDDIIGVDQENGADSVDDSDSLGNSGSKKSNLTPTSAAPSSAGQKDKKRPFFKKVSKLVHKMPQFFFLLELKAAFSLYFLLENQFSIIAN
jgi:hypothetical protein